MTGIKILGTGRFIPERAVSNGEFAAIVETSDEWITARTGIKERHLASAAEPVWHMGAKAAEAALEAAGLCAEDIGMIIVATATPDYHTPSAACIIQYVLGAPNAFAFDVNAACAGFTYALDMARRYLIVGDIKNILVIGAEALSQITNYEDRSTCVLFGDGAGACVVTASDGRFGAFLRSEATAAKHIYAKKSRKKVPFVDDKPALEPFPPILEEKIHMDGRDVYKLVTKAMPEAVEKACARIGVAPGDLDLVIPHQANARIIETASKNLGLPEEKVYVNIQNYGNTSGASIAIALDECVRAGRVRRGDLVCAVGFGAGLIYGAVVFDF